MASQDLFTTLAESLGLRVDDQLSYPTAVYDFELNPSQPTRVLCASPVPNAPVIYVSPHINLPKEIRQIAYISQKVLIDGEKAIPCVVLSMLHGYVITDLSAFLAQPVAVYIKQIKKRLFIQKRLRDFFVPYELQKAKLNITTATTVNTLGTKEDMIDLTLSIQNPQPVTLRVDLFGSFFKGVSRVQEIRLWLELPFHLDLSDETSAAVQFFKKVQFIIPNNLESEYPQIMDAYSFDSNSGVRIKFKQLVSLDFALEVLDRVLPNRGLL